MSGLRISQLPSGIPSLSGIVPFTNDTKDETFYGVVEDFLNLQSLASLSDVDLSGVEEGNFIVYNSGTWIPASGALGSGGGGGDGSISQGNGTLIDGSGNNYNPGTTADTVRVSGINDAVLTGLSYTDYANDAGLFINVGSGNITIRHLNASSDAANRFSIPWAGDYVLSPSGGAALVLRDKTDNFWRIV
jgi:hypothetical protein